MTWVAIWETWGIWVAIWGIEIKPPISKSDSQNFNGYFLFVVKIILLKGDRGIFWYPFNLPQLTLPLRTLLKIQSKLFIKLAQKTPSFRVQDVSA